jgi:hypothetical protein
MAGIVGIIKLLFTPLYHWDDWENAELASSSCDNTHKKARKKLQFPTQFSRNLVTSY